MKSTDILTVNKSGEVGQSEVELNDLQVAKGTIHDDAYFDFISSVSNGGLYFSRALHLYGFSKERAFHNIFEVNAVFKKEYGPLANHKFVFGQDIFGNQFAFSHESVVGVNAETGEVDFLARDFNDWLALLSEDFEYLTGVNMLRDFESLQQRVGLDQRLCAKKPFVIGGEFKVENLYAQHFPLYMESNANIARQINGRPDGTKIEFRTVE